MNRTGTKSRLVTVLAASVIFFAAAVRGPSAGTLSIDFLDVGQGDAILVRHGRMQILIDGGPDRGVLAKAGRLMPFFDRTIEHVVLTHPHADHVAGLSAVLENYHVRTVWTNGDETDSPVFAAFKEALRRSGAAASVVHAGEHACLGGICLSVVWPPPAAAARAGLSANDASLVLLIDRDGGEDFGDGGRSAALLMGDASAPAEASLLETGTPLSSAVLKVGHHGSRQASSAAFLAAVSPEQAVIEVGRNSFGHPSSAVLGRLKRFGIEAWRTDLDGDIRLIVGRGRLEVRSGCVWGGLWCRRVWRGGMSEATSPSSDGTIGT